MIPIIALLIPVVAIMSAHQQRMASILNKPQGVSPEMQSLAAEVSRLRDIVNQQQITIDNLTQALPSVPPLRTTPPNIEARLGGGF